MEGKYYTKEDLESFIGTEVKKMLSPMRGGENNYNHRDYRQKGSPARDNESYHYRTSAHHADRRYFNRDKSQLMRIKLMITYVKSPTTFYGQHLSPDLMDYSNELGAFLERMCPSLIPAATISKFGLYATTWCNFWYRCITCGPPDTEDKVEVYFVDYGNMEVRNISDLVQITNHRIKNIPYLATCFKLAGLRDCKNSEEANREALEEYNTTSVLEGVVTKLPSYDAHTDIILLRREASDHQQLTYNSLMLEKKYAMKVGDEDDFYTKPLPCYYRYKQINQRLQHLSEIIRDKEEEILELKNQLFMGGSFLPNEAEQNVSPKSKPILPCEPSSSISSRGVDEVSSSTDYPQAIPEKEVADPFNQEKEVISDDKLKKDVKPQNKQENIITQDKQEDIVTQNKQEKNIVPQSKQKKDIVPQNKQKKDIVPQKKQKKDIAPQNKQKKDADYHQYFRDVFHRLYKEFKSYIQHKKSCDTTSATLLQEFHAIKQTYDEIDKEFQVVNKVASKKQAVDDANGNLKRSINAIKILNSNKGLELAVKLRDDDLKSVVTRIDEFIEAVDSSDFKMLCEKLEKTAENSEQNHESEDANSLDSLDQTFQNVSRELETMQDTQVKEHKACDEALSKLSETFKKISDDLSQTMHDTSDHPGDVLSDMTLTTETLHNYNTSIFNPKPTLQPSITNLKSLVLAKKNSVYAELQSYIDALNKYRTDKKHLSHVIENTVDLTGIKSLRGEIKKKRRELRMAVAVCEFDDSSELESDDESIIGLRQKMLELHSLLQKEDEELNELCDIAADSRPELLIQYPQLKYLIDGHKLLRTSWDVNDFILPNSETFVNEVQQNVRQGFYGEDSPIYFVEYPIHGSTSTFEESALQAIKDNLKGCFAIIPDRKGLRAYGLTKAMS